MFCFLITPTAEAIATEPVTGKMTVASFYLVTAEKTLRNKT